MLRATSISAFLFTLSMTIGAVADAASVPFKPHAQLMTEVIDFLMSDVGYNGVLTMDGDPDGDPVPPYFYHYAIRHNDNLRSNTNGYPGYASISYPGYTASIGIDAFLAWWAYSGDEEALARARALADWLIDRRTPPTDYYGDWVYSTQTDAVMGGGFDGDAVMSDKPGMFGRRCLRLYDITGEATYLTAAHEIADTYVQTQLTGGTANEGRWPFRVRPSDGTVRQDYTSHLIPAIRLLEELELRAPGSGYGSAAAAAWAWLENNPLNPVSSDYMHWEGFYEDIGPAEATGLFDHYSAENTIAGLLHRDAPGDLQFAIDILEWSTDRYLAPDSVQNGYGVYAPAMLEWDAWPNSTYAATGQWAYVNLLLDDAASGTGLHDPAWRPRAIQAMHTLTFGQGTGVQPSDGRMLTTVRELNDPFLFETWYEQNFNTVIYVWLCMGMAPELAPSHEDHLIRFDDTELQSIEYQPTSILSSWSAPGTVQFKLQTQPFAVQIDGTWQGQPGKAGAPGWTWDSMAGVCSVDQPGGDVVVALGGVTAAPAIPELVRWARAYPNPFNPRVTLPLELSAPAQVRMRIYDTRGRLITSLIDGRMPAGHHFVQWMGTDDRGIPVVSGNYLATLEIGTQRLSQGLVLVR